MPITTKTTRAPIGMRASYWAPVTAAGAAGEHNTYGTVQHMGGSVKGYVAITTVTGDIHADDVVQLHSERFVSAQVDVETDCSDLELNASVYGHTYADGLETSKGDDEAKPGGYAFIEPILLKDKTVTYRATFLYNVTAIASSEKTEADTRKNDFNPKMSAVSFLATTDNTGDWRDRQEFASQALADAWIQAQFAG